MHYRNSKDFCDGIFWQSLQEIFPQNLENDSDKDADNFLLSCNNIIH